MNVTEEMDRELRAQAALSFRSLHEQLRFTLMEGLKHLRDCRGNGHLVERGAISGHASFAEERAKDIQGQAGTFGAKIPPKRRTA